MTQTSAQSSHQEVIISQVGTPLCINFKTEKGYKRVLINSSLLQKIIEEAFETKAVVTLNMEE